MLIKSEKQIVALLAYLDACMKRDGFHRTARHIGQSRTAFLEEVAYTTLATE